MRKLCTAAALCAELLIPADMRADDHDHDRDRDRRRTVYYFDRDNHDRHEWNENEERAYRHWLEQERHRQYRDWKHANKREQREYWRWRHANPDWR
jgi:hypothetical protein